MTSPDSNTDTGERVCPDCQDELWVCERHLDKPWGGSSMHPNACHCGAPGGLRLIAEVQRLRRELVSKTMTAVEFKKRKESIMIFPEGNIKITYPEKLSTTSVEYIEEYFGILIRGLKRSAKIQEKRSDA